MRLRVEGQENLYSAGKEGHRRAAASAEPRPRKRGRRRHPQRFLLSSPTCLCLRTPGLQTFRQSVGCLCLRTSCLCLQTPGLRTFCLWALLWVPGSSVCGPSSHSGLLHAYHSTAFGPAVQVPRHLRASHAPLGSGRLRVLLTATAQAMCLWALARGLLTTCCGHGHSLQQFGAVPLSCGCSEAAGVRL